MDRSRETNDKNEGNADDLEEDHLREGEGFDLALDSKAHQTNNDRHHKRSFWDQTRRKSELIERKEKEKKERCFVWVFSIKPAPVSSPRAIWDFPEVTLTNVEKTSGAPFPRAKIVMPWKKGVKDKKQQ